MTYENLDEKLVNALLNDGRSSLRNLAEDLDVSVTTVSNHLSDLDEQGVIKGYTPKVDYGELGYDVTAVIQLKVEGTAITDVAATLRDAKQMVSVYEVTGDHDVIAIAKFKDTDGMNDEIKELLNDVNVKETNTSVVLNTVCEHEQFPLDVTE
ncbi:HTH-type transcriptional regulator Lrp [Halocatena pleomorpha]|uniref:Lrp/AsnC family transcriptional regulator n=1 Tax=Halocatena pleomorpha TaxID=1785090 RepID=A0A3P3R8Z2_9EURY|nr:HTH-type transcriptional regulator Lrp [Halocatena pleomorpha]RRJ29120.1 Lrp/AsnC family transcriptional regulator [Halocatena pleomorpha]